MGMPWAWASVRLAGILNIIPESRMSSCAWHCHVCRIVRACISSSRLGAPFPPCHCHEQDVHLLVDLVGQW